MGQDSIRHVLTAEASRIRVLWASVIKGVLTARRFFGLEGLWARVVFSSLASEASRIGVLWASVIKGVLAARRFFGLEGLWVSVIKGVLAAEASTI